eukprot:TRINITY_DN7863_c0_g1_i1.p1 TRINITY_DN7863_c0_g1~~TRINITY_DN7863_c0_g1_i1.p1  ORF type:complete len:648 (+),score=254.64 TRINITY_DN7863_c0_g1_i1:83-1945(+)
MADGGSALPDVRKGRQDPPRSHHIPEAVQPMWSRQATLPRLPVPALEHTVAMYLKSVRPLCTPAEWERTRKACAEFLTDGSGEALQQRLLARAASKKNSSWLIDWWNELSYLGYRDPVTVWVNYFYMFRPDRWSGGDQITKAAGLVKACLRYKDLVTSGDLPVEMAGARPQDMSMYKFLFNAYRVPHEGKDYYVTYDSERNHHIAVIVKGRVYTFNTRDASGAELSMADIGRQLAACKRQAAAKGPAELPVGVMTAENRDVWAAAWDDMQKHRDSAQALETIASAVLVMCLDDEAPGDDRDAHARLLWHGDGTSRWFDKPLEFVVCADGSAGFNGEHGLMDGTPTTSLCDWVLTQLHQGKVKAGTDRGPQPEPTECVFTPTQQLKDSIAKAKGSFQKLISGQQMKVLMFDDFGKDQIKKWRVSPDAFAQMAYQLAYTRMTGQRAPTYESCSVRSYLHGRTETIRSCHMPGCDFVDAMRDSSKSPKEQYKLLQAAAAHQGMYSRKAASAEGCDRHLLGLKLLRKDGERPDIFEDPVFTRSCSWVLSTSALSSEHFYTWGFGEVVPNGLGVAYMTMPKNIAVTVSSLVELRPGAEQFHGILQQTLRDMGAMCRAATAAPAKL